MVSWLLRQIEIAKVEYITSYSNQDLVLYRAPFQNGIAKCKQLALNKPNIIQHKLILGKFYQEAELNYFVEETKTPTPN